MLSGNVLVLTYWSYKDPLIQTYTLPYLRIMRKSLSPDKKIWLRTLEQERYRLSPEEKQKAEADLKKEGIFLKTSPYKAFGVKAMVDTFLSIISLWIFCLKHRIKIIHMFCTPPAILGYSLSVLTGAKIVIDSYEPHAEAMVENGVWKPGSMSYKILFAFERMVTRRAAVIISATEGMKKYALEKYRVDVTLKPFYVKPACVDLSLFRKEEKKNIDLLKKLGLTDKIVGVYAGKFGGIYLQDEVFQLIRVAEQYWGESFSMLILSAHSKEEIMAMCDQAGVRHQTIVHAFIPHHEVPLYMGLADFAITPVKSIPTKRYCTPIKDGEYWALGLPVIITRDISDDSDIIEKHGAGYVLKQLNEQEYKKAIAQIAGLLGQYSREELFAKIRYIAEEYRSFKIAQSIYSSVYS